MEGGHREVGLLMKLVSQGVLSKEETHGRWSQGQWSLKNCSLRRDLIEGGHREGSLSTGLRAPSI